MKTAETAVKTAASTVKAASAAVECAGTARQTQEETRRHAAAQNALEHGILRRAGRNCSVAGFTGALPGYVAVAAGGP